MENVSNFAAKANAALAEKLFTAIRTERKDDIENHLCCGADPNFILLNGHSPFHLASGCEESFEYVSMILKYDGNPNVRNHEGQTPLHIATSWGRLKSMKLLAENGADILLKDDEGRDLRGFANENGSPECISLVERLFRDKLSLKRTPKSSKEGKRDIDLSKNKENTTPNMKSSKTVHSVSVRSPLHEKCDDSWIVKDRGMARRRRLNSGKNSRDNSPAGSPVQRNQVESYKNVSCSPCCKTPREMQPEMNTGQHFGHHINFSSNRIPLQGVCVPISSHFDFSNHQPCCGAVHVPYVLTPVLKTPAPSCESCAAKNDWGKVPADLDTTDKCIGTSILDPSREKAVSPININTDSVACQVTINQSPDAIDESVNCAESGETSGKVECRKSESAATATREVANGTSAQIKSADAATTTREVTAFTKNADATTATTHETTTGFESKLCTPASYTSLMDDFLKGLDRFIDDKKGIDASSPDHSISFAIGVKSNTASPLPISRNDNINISDQIENSNKSPTPTVSEKPQPKHKSSVPHCENLPENSIPREKTSQKNDFSSPSRNLLLSTKVPLSESEMAKLYGEHVLQDNKITADFTKTPPKEFSNISSVERGEDSTEKNTFTFSESTVPVETSENTEKVVTASPATPENHGCSSISLRKFAASRLELSQLSQNNSTSKKESSEKNACKTGDIPSSIQNTTTVSSNSRLHSTALNDTRGVLGSDEEIAWNISIIKADGTIVSENSPSDDVFNQEGSSAAKSPAEVKSETEDPPSTQMLSTCSSTSSQSTIIYNWKTFWKGESLPVSKSTSKRKKRGKKVKSPQIPETPENSPSEDPQVPVCTEQIEKLTDAELRNKLIALGYNPGPIAACREMYNKKLQSLEQNQMKQKDNDSDEKQDHSNSVLRTDVKEPRFSAELNRLVMGHQLPDTVLKDDEMLRQQFEQPDPNLRWREGTMKSSFTYLLLDPRVTDKLPVRARHMPDDEVFKAFVGAIFYIGKGKQSRPCNHLYEAMQTNILRYKLNPSRKIQHIHDIWGSGLGVISLHVYQSVIACEAYTREAAMIEAVGLGHLTNLKKGEYYGAAASWDPCRKRRYGAYLIKKAKEVLMIEGERHIRPENLRSHNTRQWTQVAVAPILPSQVAVAPIPPNQVVVAPILPTQVAVAPIPPSPGLQHLQVQDAKVS